MRYPLATNRIRRGLINNTFGLVRKNAQGEKKPHQGWDFEARVGTPCYAVGAGIIHSTRDAGDYGLQVVLTLDAPHKGKPLHAFYAHLLSVDVHTGQRVAEGDQIGRTGESGNARGMPVDDQHLHFELRTEPTPGLGLGGRISPFEVYKHCPLDAPVVQRAEVD
jgi:murein DD-endopeptidase MepM/ murein hydrolase activator NlpD